jgi:plasmid maintenance system antidote protein VapI
MAAAKALGIHSAVLSDLLERRRGVTARIAVRLLTTFGETRRSA